jgi:N-acetylglutamate synthase-like GNAT family acetyltransferase
VTIPSDRRDVRTDEGELPNWFILRSLTSGQGRALALLLLRETEADASVVAGGVEAADEVYALYEPGAGSDEEPAAAVVVRAAPEPRAVEFVGVAVGHEWRGHRLGPRMIADVLDALRARGVRRARAVASREEPDRTRLLEEAGFHPADRRRDPVRSAAPRSPGAPDRRHNDLVLFEQDL